MTDDFDVSLRRRLAAVASAVPVAPPGDVTAVVRQPVRAKSTSQLALAGVLPVLAILMIGALVAGFLNIGPGPRDSSAATDGSSVAPTDVGNGPIAATKRSGAFELTVWSAKARYEVDEPIDIEASLVYLGSGSVQIAHGQGAGGTAVGFGVEEPVIGELRLAPVVRESCERSVLQAGNSLKVPFAKAGGGWSGDDPRADEYRAWFEDPVLRLPAGVWHVYSVAGFSIDTCSPDPIQIRVDLMIEVVKRARVETPEPLASAATDIDLLTAPAPENGCWTQYNEGRLVRDVVTGLGIFMDRMSIRVVWPFGFSARDEAGVAGLIGLDGKVVAREGQVVAFSGPGPGEDGLIHACGDVRVVDADPTDAPSVGAVHAVDEDGTFRLEIRSSKSVYVAGEPLDIVATLAHIGSEETGGYDSGILFMGTQADGTHSFAPGPMVLVCINRSIRELPEERELADWPKVRSLPAGTWRISASFSGSAPACTGGRSSLRASIDVTIVAAAEPTRTIPLLTATDVEEVSSERFCGLVTPHGSVGELALDPSSGLGLASESGEIQPIRWPPGFSAEVLPDGAILYGAGGQIVAREGDRISFPAGIASDGVLSVCGQFHFG